MVQVLLCKEAQEMLGLIWFHHLSIFTGLSMTLWIGYGYVTVAFFVLTIEISSIFLNYRSVFSKDEMGKPLPMVIQVLFFITFTVARMVLIPYYLYMEFEVAYYTWDVLSGIKRVAFCYMVFVYVAMYLIHIQWYYLILRGLFKMLGIIKPKPKSEQAGYSQLKEI